MNECRKIHPTVAPQARKQFYAAPKRSNFLWTIDEDQGSKKAKENPPKGTI